MRRAPKRDILHGNILEQTLLFMFPVFTGYLLQQIYGFVDNIILGRFVGKEALAAVGGSANSIININLNCIAGLTSASMVLLAQSYGCGNMDRVNRLVRNAMSVAIIIGAFLGVLMISTSSLTLSLMKEPLDNIPLSKTYMYFYGAALVPYFIYQNGVSILRALGDSKRPVLFILITAIFKIAFDLLFAGVLKIGVIGTSLATFLSYFLTATLVLLVFKHTVDSYHYSLKDFSIDKEDTKKMMSIGIPFAIQNMMFAIPNALIQAKVNEFGTDAIAAYAAYNSVDALFWCFSNSVHTSTITMAGQNYGKGDIRRVRKITATSVMIETIGATLFGLAFNFFAPNLLGLFLVDPEALSIGVRMLRVIAVSYITYMIIEPFGAVFKACGMTRAPLYMTMISVCLSRIIYIYCFPMTDVIRVIFAYPLSWIITAVLYFIYFHASRKLKV